MVEWSKWLDNKNAMHTQSLDGVTAEVGLKALLNNSQEVPREAVVFDSAGGATVYPYLQRIKVILRLAARFDPNMDAVIKITDIHNDYVRTGILTKKEMEFLNRMYLLLSHVEKTHPEKETTIGHISTILGELNGKT